MIGLVSKTKKNYIFIKFHNSYIIGLIWAKDGIGQSLFESVRS